jgi:tetratricopeptide (TPR) repeat protein
MIHKRVLSILLSVLIFSNVSKAQTSSELYIQAEDFTEYGNYYQAIDVYQKLLRESPNNANLNFKIGFCYLNTATDKVKAIPFLEFASNNINFDYKTADISELGAPIETLYYLGKAYHVNYRIDDAEQMFLELKGQLTSENQSFIEKVNHELASCQVARMLMKAPVEMKVSNLSGNVNSIYTEHSPVISGDESLLIYTSKRESNTGGIKTDDGQYFEDIYYSGFDGKGYSQATKISNNINTPGHEASIGLSFDGTKLFIYKDDNGDGNIYISTRKGAEWEVPEKMPEPINSKYRETHASISFDQNEIYFTSDRKGGFGGLDIYRVRRLPNGNWSKAQNMGSDINTKYDEEGPYLHPDGTSLFFSSQGHNTMGGFDIFVSFVDENDKWSTPQNLGYPINTPDDDVYYVPSVDGRRAYYASFTNNSIGSYDLFRIDLAQTHIRNQTVIAGIARSSSGVLLKNPVITVNDVDDNLFGIYTPDPETGKFLFILPRGQKFTALFESSNFPPFLFNITVPEYSYDQSKQVVIFDEIISQADRDLKLLTSENPLKQRIVSDTDDSKINLPANEVGLKDGAKLADNSQTQINDLNVQNLLVANELNAFDKNNPDLASNKDAASNDSASNTSMSDNSSVPSGTGKSGVETDEQVSSEMNENDRSKSNFIWWVVLNVLAVAVFIYFFRRRRKNN